MRVSEIIPLQTYVVRRRVRRVPPAIPLSGYGGYSPGFPAYTERFKVFVKARRGRYVHCIRQRVVGVSRDPDTLKVTWGLTLEHLVVPSWRFERRDDGGM